MAKTIAGEAPSSASKFSGGRVRWGICALLFFATTINYIDRQVIGILKPTLTEQFGWSELDYSWIVFAFQTAYAIGLLFVGKLMDRIGTKIGFALAIVVWSIAAMAHAWAPEIGTFTSLGVIVGAMAVAVIASVIKLRLDRGRVAAGADEPDRTSRPARTDSSDARCSAGARSASSARTRSTTSTTRT